MGVRALLSALLLCLSLSQSASSSSSPLHLANATTIKKVYNVHLHLYQQTLDNLIKQMASNILAEVPPWYGGVLQSCMRLATDIAGRAKCLSRAFDMRQAETINSTPVKSMPLIYPKDVGRMNRKASSREKLQPTGHAFRVHLPSRKRRSVRLTDSADSLAYKNYLNSRARVIKIRPSASATDKLNKHGPIKPVVSGRAQQLALIELLTAVMRRARGQPVLQPQQQHGQWQHKLDRYHSLLNVTQLQQQTQSKQRSVTDYLVELDSVLAGNASSVSVLSPQLLSLSPASTQHAALLSPRLFSLLDQDSLSLPSLLRHNANKQDWIRLISEASGATEVVEDVLDWLDEPSDDGRQQLLKAHLNQLHNWRRFHDSLDADQRADIDRHGYSFLKRAQYNILYGDGGMFNATEVGFNPSEFVGKSSGEQQQILEDGIRHIAGEPARTEHAKWALRYKDALSPYMFAVGDGFSSEYGNTHNNGTPPARCPLQPSIGSPTVIGHTTLSPSLFSPSVLAPYVLSATTLSPSVGNPAILSPGVLSPITLTPYVMGPGVLSPTVMVPSILSPHALSPTILGPSVMSPSVLSPSVLGGSVLSPSLMSPGVLSPGVLNADVLSPGLLSRKRRRKRR